MHVLVKSRWCTGDQVYHEPSEDNPDEPKCGYDIHPDIEWVRKDPDVIPHHRPCKRCEGKREQEQLGPNLSSKLAKMDPEAI